MLAKHHYLDLVAGRFATAEDANLESLFDTLRQDKDGGHLVVHFHGGLVSRQSALDAAEALLPAYRAAGAYPVFFVWNSDAWTTVTANLAAIVQEKAFLRLVRRLAQMAAGALLGGNLDKAGLGIEVEPLDEFPEDPEELERHLSQLREPDRKHELTEAEEKWAEQQLKKDPILQQEQARIAAGQRPYDTSSKAASGAALPLRTSMSPQVRGEIAAEAGEETEKVAGVFWTVARYGAKILAAVVSRYVARRHHGLYATVVQEVLRALYLDALGAAVWGAMKTTTADAFGTDHLCGGTGFLKGLAQGVAGNVRRVTLIGHSTGAIYITHFLRHADALLPKDVRCDVIFLAPACTFKLLHENLDLYKRRVAHLRLFGLKDERERSYWEVPVVFRGSLLYIVAGLLEDEVDMPLLGMQRYHTGEAPFDGPEVRDVLAWLHKPVWAVSEEGPGRESGAMLHGGFDREPRTLASVQHLMRSGF